MRQTHLNVLLSMGFLALGCSSDSANSNNDNNEPCVGKCDVIGEDDRYEGFDENVPDSVREIGRSTAVLVDNSVVFPEGDVTHLSADLLGDAYFMCPDERFATQPATGFCSSWLVAPDIVVTNGHCMLNQQTCDNTSLIFDYSIDERGQDMSLVKSENVYQCDKLLVWDDTIPCEVDYAVFKLDRPVEGREPLKVRQAGDALETDNLIIIGHPFGLPRKYALAGDVVKVGTNNFSTTHDIFGGNSGSGMFNAETGEVQGLVTCGGSNLVPEAYDEGWSLSSKTGIPCDASCDGEGGFPDGTWSECDDAGERFRCVCASDGSQLVWESREQLYFEKSLCCAFLYPAVHRLPSPVITDKGVRQYDQLAHDGDSDDLCGFVLR